jgi:FdhD protein
MTRVLTLGPDAAVEREDTIAVEAPLEIRIAGKSLTVVMRTPGHDEELVRGFLFAEGMIASPDDLVGLARPERLTGDEVGNVIDVTLRPGTTPATGERLFYASSSCGVCGKNAISALTVRAPIIDTSLIVSASVLTSLPDRLRAAQPMFAATGGVHASGLFSPNGELQLVREDVGRHNAFDKVIGAALEKLRVPLSNFLILFSGRVSYELVQKAIAVGLPIIAAVGAPSTLAVDLAEQFGVTLVGFLRGGSMNVYAHADRISHNRKK